MPESLQMLIGFLAAAGILLLLWAAARFVSRPDYGTALSVLSRSRTAEDIRQELRCVLWLERYSGVRVTLVLLEERLPEDAAAVLEPWLRDGRLCRIVSKDGLCEQKEFLSSERNP